MNVRRKALAGVAAAAVVLGISAAGWRASGVTEPSAPAVEAGVGVGETLLLVIADVVTPAESAATLESLNAGFGDVQGFYADATDGYQVTGALLQASPDSTTVDCHDALGSVAAPLAELMSAPDCADVHAPVRALLPITTTFVPSSDVLSYLSTTPCGTAALPPCVADRFAELLGPDLQMDAGKFVLATAFRTKRGAEEFLELARSVGATGLVVVQARKLAGGDVGLGQEPHPDGSGPLTSALPDQAAWQR